MGFFTHFLYVVGCLFIFAMVIVSEEARSEKNEQKQQKLDDVIIKVTKTSKHCVRKLQEGDVITMHAIGKIRDTQQVFENSRKLRKPLVVQYVPGVLITGVFDGIIQMCAGESRQIDIPASQAYAATPYTSPNTGVLVPANTDVVFDIDMLDVSEPPSGSRTYDNIMEAMGMAYDFKISPNMSRAGGKGVPLNLLKKSLISKLEEESRTKQLPIPVNDVSKQVLMEALQMSDVDKDGYLNKNEFMNNMFFKQDGSSSKLLDKMYKEIESATKDKSSETKDEL